MGTKSTSHRNLNSDTKPPRKSMADEVSQLKQKIIVLLRENSRLKKQLEEVKIDSFDRFGVDSQLTEIKLKSRNGMTQELLAKAKDALSDALILKRNTLNEVADLMVNQLKQSSGEGGWLCGIVSGEVESAMSHNVTRTCSASFIFGDGKTRYKARLLKMSDSDSTKNE